jgi:hypothetical protein
MSCLTSFVHFEDMTFFPDVPAIFLFANVNGDSDRTQLVLTAKKTRKLMENELVDKRYHDMIVSAICMIRCAG